MESEKVKEIKKALENMSKDLHDRFAYRYEAKDKEKFGVILYADILTLIKELESENEQLRQELKDYPIMYDICNEREYRKKFNDEWRKEYQKELDKQGNGHIAGYPDFDLVYKLYFEQKDRIALLEKDKERLRKAKVVYETVDYCYEDLKKAEKRIAELENIGLNEEITVGEYLREMQRLKDRVAELEKENAIKTDTIVDLLKKQEFYEKEKLTKFAERLKENFDYEYSRYGALCDSECNHIIDETLKEFEK